MMSAIPPIIMPPYWGNGRNTVALGHVIAMLFDVLADVEFSCLQVKCYS